MLQLTIVPWLAVLCWLAAHVLHLISPDQWCPPVQLDYRAMARGGALGPRRVSPAESALVTAVLGTGAAQVRSGRVVVLGLHSQLCRGTTS